MVKLWLYIRIQLELDFQVGCNLGEDITAVYSLEPGLSEDQANFSLRCSAGTSILATMESMEQLVI